MVVLKSQGLWALCLACVLLASCSLDFVPDSVHCQSDDHCPDGYFCSGQAGISGLCTEGERPVVGDDDDSGDDDVGDDDDNDAADDDDVGDDDSAGDDDSGDDDSGHGDDDDGDDDSGDDDDSAGDDDDSGDDDSSDDDDSGDDDSGDDDSGDDDTGDDDSGDDDTGDDDDSASSCLTVSTQQGMNFVHLCAGTFEMGCTAGQSGCASNESPSHDVTLTRDFWMSKTEVTQGQWESLMGNNPSWFSPAGVGTECGLTCPVEMVNWSEAWSFANAVSAAEGLAVCYTPSSGSVNSPTGLVYDCEGYRLPTEAEWEYAARAGTDLLYAGSNSPGGVAWYGANSGGSPHPVATMLPNDWGLYDMSGNVWEWVWDRYSATYYSGSSSSDPEGPSIDDDLVLRGGAWHVSSTYSRVAFRHYDGPPGWNANVIGFRLARTAP